MEKGLLATFGLPQTEPLDLSLKKCIVQEQYVGLLENTEASSSIFKENDRTDAHVIENIQESSSIAKQNELNDRKAGESTSGFVDLVRKIQRKSILAVPLIQVKSNIDMTEDSAETDKNVPSPPLCQELNDFLQNELDEVWFLQDLIGEALTTYGMLQPVLQQVDVSAGTSSSSDGLRTYKELRPVSPLIQDNPVPSCDGITTFESNQPTSSVELSALSKQNVSETSYSSLLLQNFQTDSGGNAIIPVNVASKIPFGTININQNKSNDVAPFPCEQCPKAYHCKGDLNRYIKEIHDKRRLLCQLCNRGYKRNATLMNHLNKKHSSDESKKENSSNDADIEFDQESPKKAKLQLIP